MARRLHELSKVLIVPRTALYVKNRLGAPLKSYCVSPFRPRHRHYSENRRRPSRVESCQFQCRRCWQAGSRGDAASSGDKPTRSRCTYRGMLAFASTLLLHQSCAILSYEADQKFVFYRHRACKLTFHTSEAEGGCISYRNRFAPSARHHTGIQEAHMYISAGNGARVPR